MNCLSLWRVVAGARGLGSQVVGEYEGLVGEYVGLVGDHAPAVEDDTAATAGAPPPP